MHGLVILHKPPGITSRDAINCVQRLVRPAKIGHAGTLDPLAEGVLVAAVGPATRLVAYVQRMTKHYRGSFLLGRSSDTEDIQGTVIPVEGSTQPSLAQVQAVLPAFCGRLLQRPPLYSAVKVAGRRAYRLARSGKAADLEPRPVEVHAVELVAYDYPQLTLDIRCGSGTYVRSLGRDIAIALGTEAVMESLTRTRIGDFSLEDAVAPDDLTCDTLRARLLPPSRAVADLPRWVLSDELLAAVAQGKTIDAVEATDADEVAAFDRAGRLRAILVPRSRDRWRPRLVMGAAVSE